MYVTIRARRLGFARRQQRLRGQSAEDLGVAAHGAAGLREHVVGVAVTGVRDGRVPSRVGVLGRGQTPGLRRHADPCEPVAHELRVRHHPVGAGVDAARDVEPLHDDAAVELLGIRRSVDDETGRVGLRVPSGHGPLAVVGERSRRRVLLRGPRQEELGLLVADLRQVERRRRHRRRPLPTGRRGHGDVRGCRRCDVGEQAGDERHPATAPIHARRCRHAAIGVPPKWFCSRNYSEREANRPHRGMQRATAAGLRPDENSVREQI